MASFVVYHDIDAQNCRVQILEFLCIQASGMTFEADDALRIYQQGVWYAADVDRFLRAALRRCLPLTKIVPDARQSYIAAEIYLRI